MNPPTSSGARALFARLLAPAAGLLDLIHPPRCSLCDELLDEPGAPICPTCRFGFDPLEEPVCDRCGTPLGGSPPSERPICPQCLRTPPTLTQIRSGFAFGGPCQQAILALKQSGRRELADFLADELSALGPIRACLAQVELLVPVPLHRRRLIERGFNQSALLATRLAARFGRRGSPDALRRSRPTPAQSSLSDRAARLANVQQAFAVRRPELVVGRAVCLIDDVVTTGATLAACAGPLFDAGARSVRAVTVARTLMR